MREPEDQRWPDMLLSARTSRRGFLRGALLGTSGLAAAALIGCGDDDDDDDDGGGGGGGLDEANPFRIAVPGDLTGFLAYYSGNNVKGAQAAVDEINAAEGILGRKVELDIRDAATDANKGSEIGKEMVLSGDFNAMYMAIPLAAGLLAPEITRAGLLTITTSGDARMADPTFSPFSFELPANAVDQASSIACYVKTLPHRSVAIVTADFPYNVAQAETWQTLLEADGIEITAVEQTTSGGTDFITQFTKLKASNPDALLMDAGGPDFAGYVDAIKNLNWELPVIGGNSVTTADIVPLLASVDDLPADFTATAWSINAARPEGLSAGQQRALTALSAAGVTIEQPLYNYAFGWDAIYLIKYGADTAGSDDGEAMVEALEGLGAIEEQSQFGLILAPHYDFTADFHGLASVPLTTVVPGALDENGLLPWGGVDWTPCA